MSRRIEEINLETIAFSKQKVNSANRFLYVYSDKKSLILKLPKIRLPFGLQRDTLSKKNQYIIDFSLEKQTKSLESFQNFEAVVISKVHADFFPEKTIDEVKDMYTSFVKYPENPMYSPTLRAKIIIGEDMKPKCDFYNNEKNEEGKYPKIDVIGNGNETYLLQVMGKSSYNESIIECIGLWFFGNKFGLSFKVTQVMLHPQEIHEEQPVKDCQFIDSDSDTSNSEAAFLGE